MGARAIHHRLREVGAPRENIRPPCGAGGGGENSMGVSVEVGEKGGKLMAVMRSQGEKCGIKTKRINSVHGDREEEENRVGRGEL